MAHNIHYNDQTGRHSFFSVKQKAWHGLGQVVKDYPTSTEAIQFAGLDYHVEKRPLFTNLNNASGDTEKETNGIPVPYHFATLRTDNETVLGVVGKDYHVVQNREAFSFFDTIASTHHIQYETAGALGKGERLFITAKLPNHIRVGVDDLIEQYLFLTTSHDGYGSITAAFTPVRIVCNNTLNAALKNCTNAVSIKHTAGAHERIALAHRLMGITQKTSALLEATFNHWAKVRITDEHLKELIRQAMKPQKETPNTVSKRWEETSAIYQHTCADIFAYAMTSPTQQMTTTKGTLFGAYNAITGYFQNVKNYRDEDVRLKSILLGGNAQRRTQTAFNLCHIFSVKGASAFLYN